MTTAALPMAAWLALALAALLLPYVLRARTALAADGPALALVLLAGGIALTAARGGLMLPGVLLLVIAALGHGMRSLAGAMAAALSLAATGWWLRIIGLAPEMIWATTLACLAMALIARQAKFRADAAHSLPTQSLPTRSLIVSAALLFALALGAGLMTSGLNAKVPAIAAWHHWGAYLSPVHPLLAGAVPYRDFPVQYGMGPTLLFAAACAGDCWRGIYWATLLANALQFAALGWTALVLCRGMDRLSRGLALAALAAAMFVWTGYPLDWANPVATPSVGGIRFLPLALLLALIVTTESREPAGLTRAARLTGHALWLLGLAWSLETGFFTTLVWWPWLALRRADGEAGMAAKWLALVRGGAIALAAVIVAIAALAALFRLGYGVWPAPDDVLIYLRYPPGVIPINAAGAIWFVVAVLAIALAAFVRLPAGAPRRALHVCLLALIGALSYFVSRSHDNTVLNMLPWLILVMLAAQAAAPSALGAGFLRASLAGCIALVPTITFPAWQLRDGPPQFAGRQIGPSAIAARFAPDPADPAPLLDPDAAALYAALSREGAGAVVLFDDTKIMPSGDPARAWTGVNNPANFVPLPPSVIRHYAVRGAATLRRPGWLIVETRRADFALGLFTPAYDVAQSRRQGAYSAYLLSPRDAG